MNYQEATELKNKLDSLLSGYKSYSKIEPYKENYTVLVIQKDLKLPKLPNNIKIISKEPSLLDSNNSKSINPSDSGKDIDLPRNQTKRVVEVPEELRWRNREVQDIVKRIAMKPELQKRLNVVIASLEKLAFSRDPEIDRMLEIIRTDLLHYNYSKKSPIWRALMRSHQNYKLEDFERLLDLIKKAGFDSEDNIYQACHRAISLLSKLPEVKEAVDPEKQKLKNQTEEYLLGMQKACDNIKVSLNKLGLKDEAAYMKSMYDNIKNIYLSLKDSE